jgi:hypothetical protein
MNDDTILLWLVIGFIVIMWAIASNSYLAADFGVQDCGKATCIQLEHL